MYPVLLQVGGFRLHSYGVVVVVALLVGLWVAGREALRETSEERVPLVSVNGRLAFKIRVDEATVGGASPASGWPRA